ncbi:MAG: hypothetical protein EU547_04120 [Promethearchaeota archaeon]|nr:MAG: hypothetical protein EU547_04120 [Candidatus Lokiarchaeota archaeon]
MSEDQKDTEEESETDDYQEYLKEMEELKKDFSDLEDLDIDEIEDMKEAIEQVKEETSPLEEELISDEEEIIEKTSKPINDVEKKEEMMADFSDLGKMDLDELLQMKEAMEIVKEEDSEQEGMDGIGPSSDELEKKIQDELKQKKEKEAKKTEKKEIKTEEDFIEYIKPRRDKIWYHGLYYLTFEIDDHTASKYLLYDVLKEDTSKSPIDPLPEHQFYFGLGYILRLKINKQQIVRYLGNGKFRINYDIKKLKEILEDAGEPIITKPKIEEKKKKKMFREFLKDDWLDEI